MTFKRKLPKKVVRTLIFCIFSISPKNFQVDYLGGLKNEQRSCIGPFILTSSRPVFRADYGNNREISVARQVFLENSNLCSIFRDFFCFAEILRRGRLVAGVCYHQCVPRTRNHKCVTKRLRSALQFLKLAIF